MDLFVVLWFVLFFFIIAQNILQWIENENSPVLTVPATIVDMRRRAHHHRNHHSHSYYVTFEVGNVERMELRVRRREYYDLETGDRGALTYQGTRFLGFERR